ncbi:flagellar motor protein MotD [Thermithiobacillus plumbiphilus]|uniref:Flagellar motor protein MotD n=1 Tax=Thermithiobacillus plumbiphilus TaxID=1729899 RepID=A0ABU9D3Z8_9PROT
MARRKRHEEHENHERWLVSYADFITLLFAFFVVMYALSSVNEGKYRVLSESLVAAFREPARSLQPIQVGSQAHSNSSENLVVKSPVPLLESPTQPTEEMARLAAAMRKALAPLIKEGKVTVHSNARGVVVDINASILFPSGQASINPEALPLLERIASVLVPLQYAIQVEGFTDDQPIHNALYPSNWELSGARAGSVVRLLATRGIAPQRMVAAGYGEFRPVAPNDTEANRARNRRVSIAVLAPGRHRTIGQTPIMEVPEPGEAHHSK